MVQIELLPDLSHCIETVAKKEHQRAVNRLFEETTNEKLKAMAELLRMFLEAADFRKLRTESEKYL